VAMAEDIKSALHDATPSWNGFNYQGKVGVYVCLKMILEKLSEMDKDSSNFIDFLNAHTIEYEWIEDFSIKRNDRYVSLHQVKHKAGTGFSDHVGAIVTILNRKLCRLSETDFNKYINLNIDYTNCSDESEKIDLLFEQITSKFRLLVEAGYLDENHRLVDGWSDVENPVDGILRAELTSLLTDFDVFSSNTFGESKTYFHTSENVLSPIKNIDEYAGIPDQHNATVNGLRSLSSLDIYLDYDTQAEYELALSDQSLKDRIIDLISQLLEIIHPLENIEEDDLSLYFTSISDVIDKHVAVRHNNIRQQNNEGEGFQERRECISFVSIFAPLNRVLKNQNDDYWDLFCKKHFEQAYSDQNERLQQRIDNANDVGLNKKKMLNLEYYRRNIIGQYSCSNLLALISPHEISTKSKDMYYGNIINQYLLKDVFLRLIQGLDSVDTLLIKANESVTYHPSTISLQSNDEDEWHENLERCKHQISQNNTITSLLDASHLVVQASTGHDVSGESVALKNIIEAIDAEEAIDIEYRNSNVNNIKFESVENAIRIFSDE
jgi:hypothetical protein